jgi:integrase
MLERDGDDDSTRVSICSALRTAKQIIKRDMVQRLRRQLPAMPDEAVLDRWRRYRPIPTPRPVEKDFTAAEVGTIRAAGEELKGSAWLAWAMGYYAGLRAGEVQAARWGWLVQHEQTQQERGHAAWLAGRSSVWLLRVEGTKTAGATADVPLHDSVAALLLARRHRIGGLIEAGAGLDLDEDDRAPAPHDQVDLAARRAEAARDRAIALEQQQGQRGEFRDMPPTQRPSS